MTLSLPDIVERKRHQLAAHRRFLYFLVPLYLCSFFMFSLGSIWIKGFADHLFSESSQNPLSLTILILKRQPNLVSTTEELMERANAEIKQYIDLTQHKQLFSFVPYVLALFAVVQLLLIYQAIAHWKAEKNNLDTLIAICDAISAKSKQS